MNTKLSQRFADMQVLELFDTEQDRDNKYAVLATHCEWSDSCENSVVFYINNTNWNILNKNPKMSFWLLETV